MVLFVLWATWGSVGYSDPPVMIGEVLNLICESPRDPILLQKLRTALVSNPDDPKVAIGLVVFALGSLSLENITAAEAARQALLSRFPARPEARAMDEWDGLFRPCPWCGGSGKRKADLCSHCHGTGKCPACGGKGYHPLMGKREVKCSVCLGTGKCSRCGGNGRGETTCPRCNGTGRVVYPERAFRLYRAVLRSEVQGIHEGDTSR